MGLMPDARAARLTLVLSALAAVGMVIGILQVV